jgi:hypothetical protein
MSSPEVGQRFYRFDDIPSGDGCQVIVLRTFRLTRISSTGKTGTIEPLANAGKYDRPRRITLTSHHPWAHPAPDVAWADFRRRKGNQVEILRERLRRAIAVRDHSRAIDTSGALSLTFTPVGHLGAPFSFEPEHEPDPLPQ